MKIKTENLIHNLAFTDKKNRKPFSPFKLHSTVLIFSFILFALIMSVRSPLIFNQYSLYLVIELFFGFLAIACYLYAGILGLIPNTNRSVPFLIGSLSTLILLTTLILHNINHLDIYHTRKYCEIEAFVLSSLSTLVLHFVFKKFPMLEHQLLPKIIFFITPMMIALIMHSACSNEFIHVLSCHVLPPALPPAIYFFSKYKKIIKH